MMARSVFVPTALNGVLHSVDIEDLNLQQHRSTIFAVESQHALELVLCQPIVLVLSHWSLDQLLATMLIVDTVLP